MSQDATDRRSISRRLLLGALAAAPMLLTAETALADKDRGQGRGRGRGGEGRGGQGGGRGRDDGPRRYDREGPSRDRYDDRGRERYDNRYAPRGYDDGPRGLRRGGRLPPQAQGGRIENYERYRLRQPPRGYSWYRSGDGFALVGPNGIVFDVID